MLKKLSLNNKFRLKICNILSMHYLKRHLLDLWVRNERHPLVVNNVMILFEGY